jgi:hypothetical protein
LELVADYLRYPVLHAVQSVELTPQVNKQPGSQVEQMLFNTFSKVPSGQFVTHDEPDK